MALEELSTVQAQPVDRQKISKLWRIALILGLVTGFEFVCAFTLPRGVLLISIFVALTLVKAFYIVSEFMHLKYEVKTLIWSILLPLILVVWLIIALLYEGGAILNVR
jgi:cytochrome c oxidase subunit IV